MSRRNTLGALVGGGAIVALALGGCTGGSTETDVHKIIAQTLTSMSTVKTVHVQGTAAGDMLIGVDITGVPPVTPSPSGSASPSASASSSASASASASESASPSASASASASASESASPSASPSASASSSPSASPSESASPSASASVSAGASPSASGSASPTPAPSQGARTKVALTGTSVEGDIDLANSKAHLIGGVPGLPELGGELIEAGGNAFLRQYGATGYTEVAASTLEFDPGSRNGPAQYIQGIIAILGDSGVSPKLVGTEDCQEGKCWHISATLTPEAINNRLVMVGDAMGDGQFDMWVLQDSYRVARMEFQSSDPTAGAVALRLLFTNYDKAVTINAPTADQLAPTPTP